MKRKIMIVLFLYLIFAAQITCATTEIFVENDLCNQVDVSFDGPDGFDLKATIFWPFEGDRFPGVVFCPGIGAEKEAYFRICKALSSQGYVVLVFSPLTPVEDFYDFILWLVNLYFWENDFIAAINYLAERSPVADKIYPDKVAIIGHSWGSFTVAKIYQQCDVKTAIFISPAYADKYLEGNQMPILIQTGDYDLRLPWYYYKAYNMASSPKQIIFIENGFHASFTGNSIPEWAIDVCLYYCVAWLDFWLKDDLLALERIIAPLEHISKTNLSLYDLGNGDIEMR